MEYILLVTVLASTFNKIKGTERITVFALKGNLYDEAGLEGSSRVIFNLAFSLTTSKHITATILICEHRSHNQRYHLSLFYSQSV